MPGHAGAQLNRGCVELLFGDFEGGWIEPEWPHRRGGSGAPVVTW
jgi:hypothetical protein